MSTNSIGTVLRIVLIAFTLVAVWYISISIIYFLISILFGLKFSFAIAGLLFAAVMFIRMFFPKNVFV